MSVKCLSKIAILKANQEIEDNSVTITHNGKIYEPLINWDPNYKADISQHRDFCLVALKCDDAEYLTIFHDGTRQPGKHRLARVNILSICFPDFQSIIAAEDLTSSNKKQTTKIHDVTAKLYGLLRTAHLTEGPTISEKGFDEIICLQPKLRNYQKKTLKWMLHREQQSDTLKWSYEKLISTEGCEYYVNLLTLELSDMKPRDIDIPQGGILAEEMGLGKTVEIVSLILLNPRSMRSTEEDVEPKTKRLCIDKGLLNPRSMRSTEEDVEPKTKRLCIDKGQEIKFQCVCFLTNMKDIEQCSNCFLYQHKKCVRSYIDFPFSEEDGYICPKCWEQKGVLVPSAATVIISPSSIKLQWLSEINKHTNPALRVLLYEGVSKKPISPKELASYDIVLSDYTTLRPEIYFTAAHEPQMSFRRPRRKMRVNSPLILVDWWRVCLDEAQMESSNTHASMITRQLPAINRWAVTGTPIQSSLDDLKTLLNFIGLKEVVDYTVWRNLTAEFTNDRCETLIRTLQKVMWRTSKADVDNELQIPPQGEQLHFIEMTNLEKLFYSDEHADCLGAFYAKIKGLSDLKGVPTKVFNSILQPMFKLRQDCSIPVLCLKSMKSDKNVVKKFLQPQELLDHMKTTNETECKDQLRSMASIHNGTAALYFLKRDYKAAIDYYERVLSLAKKYNDTISVDSLLQIHALYNVIQAYRNTTSKDKPIVSEYEEQFNKLESKYLLPYATKLQAADKAYQEAFTALTKKNPTRSTRVWERVLLKFKNMGLAEQVVSKINDEVFLLHSSTQHNRFGMINTVLLILEIWYNKIIDIRTEITLNFKSFDYFIKNVPPSKHSVEQWRMLNNLVKSVYECHIRKKVNASGNKKREKLCQLCKTNKLLQTYECLIFDKSIDEITSNAEGTWNPTMQETILKTIFSAAKQAKTLGNYVKSCESQLETIALMKTEYKDLVKLWVEIEYTVKAYDELSMCKMRISLAKDEEEKTNFSVYDYEIEDVLAESKVNFEDAQKEFVLKYARLKYIRHLEKDTDPGPCPICRAEAQAKYVVLECGHHLCFFCLKTISELKKGNTTTLSCSVCRHRQKYTNVYFVTRKHTNKDGIDIKGDYSAKIQNIVEEVLRLKSEDENVKVIIFSHWPAVLTVIKEALNENGIRIIINTSPECVEKFKNTTLGFTCLLMSLKTRSQGLNLIEATHVFLVEPVLDPGTELQAINRVHRIGQTKPTFVHRFVVKNTIEENIYNSVLKDKSNDSVELTIEGIKKLFEMHSYNS